MKATQIDLRKDFDPSVSSWHLYRRISFEDGEREATGAAYLTLPLGVVPPEIGEGEALVFLLPMMAKGQKGDHLRFVGILTERSEVIDDLKQPTGTEELGLSLMAYSACNLVNYSEVFEMSQHEED